MSEILKVAISAAQAAGTFINQSAKNVSRLEIEQKTRHDYVSEVDRGAERMVVELIRQHYPEHQILGEEYGTQGAENSAAQWVIDPLDGTTNFLRSIPHYAVSIAHLQHGVITHGVVYDPVKDELFTAQLDQGASLNGQPLSVSSRASIRGGLFATGVPFSGTNLASLSDFTGSMTDLLQCHTSGIRRLGSAALDLAYVAAGRYDGFWEANLKPWDIAAGVLLVTEASGVVSDLKGGDDYLESGDIIAAPAGVQAEMAELMARHYTQG